MVTDVWTQDADRTTRQGCTCEPTLAWNASGTMYVSHRPSCAAWQPAPPVTCTCANSFAGHSSHCAIVWQR